MLLAIGLEIYATENWVLQDVQVPLAFYVMNHVLREKKSLKIFLILKQQPTRCNVILFVFSLYIV
jgi:hypothetical protein